MMINVEGKAKLIDRNMSLLSQAIFSSDKADSSLKDEFRSFAQDWTSFFQDLTVVGFMLGDDMTSKLYEYKAKTYEWAGRIGALGIPSKFAAGPARSGTPLFFIGIGLTAVAAFLLLSKKK